MSPMFHEVLKRMGAFVGSNYTTTEDPYIAAFDMPVSTVFLIRSEFTAQEIQLALGDVECMYMMFDITDANALRQFRYQLPQVHKITIEAFLNDVTDKLDDGTLKKEDLDLDKTLIKQARAEVMRLTMDDLLDLVKEKGVNGLTDLERERLDQLSQGDQ